MPGDLGQERTSFAAEDGAVLEAVRRNRSVSLVRSAGLLVCWSAGLPGHRAGIPPALAVMTIARACAVVAA